MDTQSIGARIAAESAKDDPLSDFDRTMVGGYSVRIDIRLRDPAQVKHHLNILIADMQETLVLIDRAGLKDRNVLFDVRQRIRRTAQKLNAYKRVRYV